MKITDIKKREKYKQVVKNKIKDLYFEINLLENQKKDPGYNKIKDIIGYATAFSDLDEDIKEKIFEFLSESYEDSIININKNYIKILKENLRNQLKKI